MNESSRTCSVIIADDHAVARTGTKAVLADIPAIEIVAEIGDGMSAIAAVKTHQPDLLILDAAMPHAKGIEVLADARRWSPNTAVILLTGFTSAGILANWLSAEVEGILLKSCEPSEMRTCVETVLAGGRFIAAEASAILDRTTPVNTLTNREREVLSMLAMGHQSINIAERLNISSRTVEKHRASLMAKVGVNSIAQLIAFALREGLLEEHRQA